ncbi:hypothetical protein [Streptomyces sp. LN499]|uniref:hypothetical protein n=1 Tax=Streptomyces sp. LN499 TaxID=3112977 RepID=UPI00371CAC11
MMLTIATNGSLLWRENRLNLFDECPPYRVTVSVYGATKASYGDPTQRQGAWDLFVQGMNAARRAKLPLRMSIIVTEDNAHEEQAMIDLCEKWGLEYNVFSNMAPTIYGGGEVLTAQSEEAPGVGVGSSGHGEAPCGRRRRRSPTRRQNSSRTSAKPRSAVCMAQMAWREPMKPCQGSGSSRATVTALAKASMRSAKTVATRSPLVANRRERVALACGRHRRRQHRDPQGHVRGPGAGLGQPWLHAIPGARTLPARSDNQHPGFGSGIHLCYGAPRARIEAQAALGALIPYLGTARLVEDPPPYRQNTMLRGPRHLPVQL